MATFGSRVVALVTLTSPTVAMGQVAFTDGSSLLNNPDLTSGVAMGAVDMNGDGLDDIIRLHQGRMLQIEFQQPDGSFSLYDHGPTSSDIQWGMAIGDVDKNGYRDVYLGGSYNTMRVFKANATGTAWEPTPLPGSVFTQCSSFHDIDNDGNLDLFICHDDGLSAPFRNDGSGGFSYDVGLIEAASTVPSDNSGNYGVVWTDYDNDGDSDLYLSKCRLSVDDPMDGRRLNLLFDNDGNGNFTDVAEAAGLRPQAQSWSTDFGDIDNDGDLDAFILNHDISSQLMINDGSGGFTDGTTASEINVGTYGASGIQAIFEDFDNDTFIDLLVTSNGSQHHLYFNDGDGSFTESVPAFPTGADRVQSAAIGDLNNDGFPDLTVGFADTYNDPTDTPNRLLLNEGNANNWLKVQLHGTTSNRDGIGARLELHGAWGVQVREVRGGEGYGVNHSMIRHFGLGTETAMASLVVRWPSGQVTTVDTLTPNTTLSLIEGCTDDDADGFCLEADCDDSNPAFTTTCEPLDTDEPLMDTGSDIDPIAKETQCGCATPNVNAGLVLVGLSGLLIRRR